MSQPDSLLQAICNSIPDIANQLSTKQVAALLASGSKQKLTQSALRSLLQRNRDKASKQPPKLRWGENGNQKMDKLSTIVFEYNSRINRHGQLPALVAAEYESVAKECGKNHGASSESVDALRGLCDEIDPEKAERITLEGVKNRGDLRMLEFQINYFFLVPTGRYATIDGFDAYGNIQKNSGEFEVIQREEYLHPLLDRNGTMLTVTKYRNHASALGDIAFVCPEMFRRKSANLLSRMRRNTHNSPILQKLMEVLDGLSNADDAFYEVDLRIATWEEVHHMFDHILLGEYLGVHPVELPSDYEATSHLLKRGSVVGSSVEQKRDGFLSVRHPVDRVDLMITRSIIELSGQIQGAMSAMRAYIDKGEYEKAFATFLAFMGTTIGYCHNLARMPWDPNATASDWLLSEYEFNSVSQLRSLDRSFLDQCMNAQSMHPAEKGLEILEDLHFANFMKIDEQKKFLEGFSS